MLLAQTTLWSSSASTREQRQQGEFYRNLIGAALTACGRLDRALATGDRDAFGSALSDLQRASALSQTYELHGEFDSFGACYGAAIGKEDDGVCTAVGLYGAGVRASTTRRDACMRTRSASAARRSTSSPAGSIESMRPAS